MKIFSSLHLLAALGVIGVAGTASAQQVDTSQWKCTSCPYPKGTTGSVDVGVGNVSNSSQKFGDYTGLDKKGAFLVLDGNVSRRGDDGYYADLWGADLGLDSRRLYGQAGREGLYSLNVGYAEAGPAEGPPVLLLHGWPYDIYSFVDVAPLLASTGYR